MRAAIHAHKKNPRNEALTAVRKYMRKHGLTPAALTDVSTNRNRMRRNRKAAGEYVSQRMFHHCTKTGVDFVAMLMEAALCDQSV